MQYIGIIYNATGVSGYSFFTDEKKVFSVSYLVYPNPDIRMDGFGKILWHKHFDKDITLVPGIRRNVVDEDGEIFGYYEYWDLSYFKMVVGGLEANVYSHSHGWDIYWNGTSIAEIVRLDEKDRKKFEEDGYDMEIRFKANIDDNAKKELYPLILALPILSF